MSSSLRKCLSHWLVHLRVGSRGPKFWDTIALGVDLAGELPIHPIYRRCSWQFLCSAMTSVLLPKFNTSARRLSSSPSPVMFSESFFASFARCLWQCSHALLSKVFLLCSSCRFSCFGGMSRCFGGAFSLVLEVPFFLVGGLFFAFIAGGFTCFCRCFGSFFHPGVSKFYEMCFDTSSESWFK